MITIWYFSVAVLGRVDERCADADSTEIAADSSSLDEAQRPNPSVLPAQEMQHAEVSSKPDSQHHEENSHG